MPPSSSYSSYIPSLDGIRAISIALVFASHVGFGNTVPGGFGVTIFFFLSGYLITTLLTREYDGYGAISLRAFYIRRVLRLGPPLGLTLIFATALALLGVAQGDLAPSVLFSQIFFVFNYFSLMTTQSWVEGLGILWSLSVEEHFYLFWPLLFIVLTRNSARIGILIGALAMALAWRCVRYYIMGDGEWVIYISTDTRFDSLVYGCLLAHLQWNGTARRIFPDRPVRYFVLAVALLVLLSTFLVRDAAFRSTLRYSLQGLALIPVFHYAITRPDIPFFRPLNWAPVRKLGVYSYTFYLVHFVIVGAVLRTDWGPDGSPQLILVSTLASLAFAAAVHRWIEAPLKPLRNRLTGHRLR